MKPERLSDAQLAALVREDGTSADAAQRELEKRHFGAVHDFADICAPGPAGDELAVRAWQQAVRHPDAGVTAALRPYALRTVLRAAAAMPGSGYPGWLDAELTAWLALMPESWNADSAGGDTGFPGPASVVAWAFHTLTVPLQTVLWQHLVERSANDSVARLLGSETPEAQEVSVLIRRAHRDLYHAYEQIHHGGMSDDCRRFHRMVMAYAGRGGREGGNTGDVVAHLEGCAYCSRAVADLKQLSEQPRELLARELLPWGGERYAASRGAESEWASGTIAVPLDGVPAAGADAPGGVDFPGAAAGSAAGTAGAVAPGWGPDGNAHDGRRGRGPGRRAERDERGGKKSGRSSGRPPRGRGGGRRPSGARPRRLPLTLGVLGVCSLAVALGYAQNYDLDSLQPSAEQPVGQGPSGPSPSESGAPPSSSPDDPPSSGDGDDGGGDGKGKGKGKDEGKGDSPAVPGAALEWLFRESGGDAAEDTSGAGRDGRAVGTPPPEPQRSEGMAFFGQQSVTSRGPVLDTDRSFSVSARVKLRNKDDYQTVASQDGAEISSFQLQYDPVEDRWEMRMHRSDSQTSPADEAESDASPRAGRWTHLTGVWDASREQIRLYVDGRLQDTVSRSGDRSTEGDFTVGRARLGDRFIRGLEGNLKEVRVFREALSDAEARSLARDD